MESRTLHDLAYVSNGHERQKLDLYFPQSSTPTPLVVYIHGGAFMFGSKTSELMPKRLLSKGYAIASLDYRLSGDACFPASVEDCKSAVRWLKAHSQEYNLDPNRFVAFGESAGAHQAAMVGTTSNTTVFDKGENLDFSSSVQGVVDYYGPTDFLQMDDFAPEGSHIHCDISSPESKYLGRDITTVPELVKKANPITYASEKTPPFFIAHGTDDHVVAFHQSVLLHNALDEFGVSNIFYPVENADHVFEGMSSEQSTALDNATDSFLNSIFDNAKAY